MRHFPAAGVLAIFLGVGLAVASDFGVATDQWGQIDVGKFTVEYVLGKSDRLLHHGDGHLRYYGSAFELALRAAKSLLGLHDTSEVFLSRHILSHGFFLLGAFACYLLAYRLAAAGVAGGKRTAAGMAGGRENRERRLLALFAMMFYLCHPLLHGHSFFNTKDTPFLAMFMIALLLAHRALDRGGAPTHAALGAWIGVIGTIRPFAFVLVPLVALTQGRDLLRGGWRERRRIAFALAVLASAAVGACVVALPYLWGDPAARLVEWLAAVADAHAKPSMLFLGERIDADERPWSYLSVWIAITTPPMVVVLAVFGGVALVAGGQRTAAGAAGGKQTRFEVLLAASVLVPVVAATFAGSLYNGWRHLYFVYGPTCLLACAGLAWLRRNGGRRLAALCAAVAALGVATPLVWIARLHPHQHLYFNFLVDRKTPERLGGQFSSDHWRAPYKEALEFLLRHHPQGLIPVGGPVLDSVHALPPADRNRIVRSRDFNAYVVIDPWRARRAGHSEWEVLVPPVYVRKVFANTVYAITKLEVDLEAAENQTHKAAYDAALSHSGPIARGRFHVYWDGRTVTYLRRECTPSDVAAAGFYSNGWLGPPTTKGRFFLQVFGDKVGAGWQHSAGLYQHNEDFLFPYRGVVLRDRDGTGANGEGTRICMARVDLGGYRVDALVTGQLDAEGKRIWSVRAAL